ncbi:MAG TPA: hypothetical protein VFQ53_20095 [Kofleriaceae bacterium]|nr:hypothetical protein [Kofleriaceae bacterium]
MAIESNEPRALTAALAQPAFATRGGGAAVHVANRHVERWAPEANANRVRSMRSLGFVDRMIAPWVETAQRSASLRLFTQYVQNGMGERAANDVSWVFPRPWYQDELDWIAAARRTQMTAPEATMLTTRGTYVAPAQAQHAAALPTALYEFVAPALSIAQPALATSGAADAVARSAFERRHDAYSPLVSLAAVQAAEVMSRTVERLPGTTEAGGAAARMSPGLRSVLTTMLSRAALSQVAQPGLVEPTRSSLGAPELVTPPAPRPAREEASAVEAETIAEQIAEQRQRIAGAQRIARQYAEQQAQQRALELQAAAARHEAELRQRTVAATTTATSPMPATPAISDEQRRQLAEQVRVAEAKADELRTATAVERARGEQSRGSDVSDAVRIEEARAVEQQRSQMTAAQRAAAERAERAATERARIEERAARRIAQRLHDQARSEAASHARTSIDALSSTTPAAPSATAAMPTSTMTGTPSADVAATLAALPPGLASYFADRPSVTATASSTLRAIEELQHNLRTVELIARTAASGGTFEPTRGPRLVMPAGLGGLVAAVDRAHAFGDRPATPSGLPLAIAAMPAAQPRTIATTAARTPALRVPTLSWLDAPAAAPTLGTTAATTSVGGSATALGAVSTTTPAALGHVAWADRWLARFAGASQRSLDTFAMSSAITQAAEAGAGNPFERLAAAAPETVFVAPSFFDASTGEPVRIDASGRVLAGPAGARTIASIASIAAPTTSTTPAAPTARAPSAADTPVVRFDDDAETPDDVFAAISQAAAANRASRLAATAPTPAPVVLSDAQRTTERAAGARIVERLTAADLVAHDSPAAVGAGFAPQLASSPFAPALRHVLPLPSAASFDVRALMSGGLVATYLAGLLAPETHEVDVATRALPAWATWSLDRGAPVDVTGDAAGGERAVPSWDPTYVQGEAIAGDPAAVQDAVAALEATAELARAVDPAIAASIGEQAARVRELVASGGRVEPALVTALAEQAERARELVVAQRAAFAPETATSLAAQADRAHAILAGQQAAIVAAEARAELAALERLETEHLTTLRSGLLATGGATIDAARPDAVAPLAPTASATDARFADARIPLAGSAARTMIEAMSLPMLGDVAHVERTGDAWAAPGMIAERAQAWSVAQERSSSDLAFDFVTPELVLAARVYGLGPAEAAQAARLAIAGPGPLSAMAGTVDRTFVQAMAIEADRRERATAAITSRLATAYPLPTGEVAAITARPDAARRDATGVRDATTTTAPTEAPTTFAADELDLGTLARAQLASTGAAFGVDRRHPRGAFLWPAGTVAALGLSAASPDGEHSMSVAALELLAAQAVAELGTYAALAPIAPTVAGALGAIDSDGIAPEALAADGAPIARRASRRGRAALGDAVATEPRERAAASEPSEPDVLGAAAALVPAARRSRFEALYVALGQSPAGRAWSPAARAARALALAGRGDDGAPISAHERAMIAWDVLPVVYALDQAGATPGTTTDDAAAAETIDPITGRPVARTRSFEPSYLRGPDAMPRGRTGRGRGVDGDDYVGDDRSFVVDVRPGLGALSARAGEALGSYVTPTAAPAPSTASSVTSTPRETGAVLRAPTASPELVQTGRPSGRYGGGEAEIPAWFEAAARKMFESQSSSPADGISLAELTLVQAAPSTQIAASTRTAPAAAPVTPSLGSQNESKNAGQKIDIEKVANEIYRQILIMMDAARARNGEPFL